MLLVNACHRITKMFNRKSMPIFFRHLFPYRLFYNKCKNTYMFSQYHLFIFKLPFNFAKFSEHIFENLGIVSCISFIRKTCFQSFLYLNKLTANEADTTNNGREIYKCGGCYAADGCTGQSSLLYFMRSHLCLAPNLYQYKHGYIL